MLTSKSFLSDQSSAKSFRAIFICGLVSLALISCSKPKKEEAPAVSPTDTTNDSSVTNKEMTFDAAGSDSGKISGLYTINFEYDKANLSDDARKKLAENANWVKSHSDVNVQIEGHCDERGSIEYNLALGERRAKAAKAYLVSLGVDARKLSVISYGKEKPVASGDSEEVYSKNRRANFVPLPK